MCVHRQRVHCISIHSEEYGWRMRRLRPYGVDVSTPPKQAIKLLRMLAQAIVLFRIRVASYVSLVLYQLSSVA